MSFCSRHSNQPPVTRSTPSKLACAAGFCNLTTETDLVPLTQEFLSHMLGVRRTTVSLSAHALQTAGLIRYARGKIKIVNRDGLKESACECYDVVRGHIDRALPPLS
jgi:CRP-like cAMP-binding protein